MEASFELFIFILLSLLPKFWGLQACAAPSLLVLFCFVLRRRGGIGGSAWLVVVMHAFNTSPLEEKAGGSL